VILKAIVRPAVERPARERQQGASTAASTPGPQASWEIVEEHLVPA